MRASAIPGVLCRRSNIECEPGGLGEFVATDFEGEAALAPCRPRASGSSDSRRMRSHE